MQGSGSNDLVRCCGSHGGGYRARPTAEGALHAEIALRASDCGADGQDRGLSEGTIAAAQFFAGNVLPEITASRGILARTWTALTDLDDEAC